VSQHTFSGVSLRGLLLGAIAGGIVAATTVLFVASKSGVHARAIPARDDDGREGSPQGREAVALPADSAEGEDAAIFAGWC
jgi:gas vesicle protein